MQPNHIAAVSFISCTAYDREAPSSDCVSNQGGEVHKTVLNGQKVTPELKAQIQAGMKNAFPLGYLGDPYDDIAPVLVFLASDASRYMTAQCAAVNGGSAMVR